MKKIYLAPQVLVTRIGTERHIAASLGMKSGTVSDENSVLVKENPGRQDYNVWNDDWSN